jgi:fatty acid desaturase
MTTTLPVRPLDYPDSSDRSTDSRANRRTDAGGKSAFGPLSGAVRRSGLLEKQTSYYWRHGLLILAGIAATAVGVTALSHTWWALLLAPVAAMLSAQVGFFGHDAGHQQISSSRTVNRRLGLIAGNVLGGLSYGWWQDKHLRHHANPNHEGLDPDVAEGVIVWSEQQAERRSTRPGRWFARHQAAAFFPLLTFEGWNLAIAGLRALRERPAKARALEATLLIVRHLTCLAFLFWFLTPAQAVLFIVIHQALYGLNLGMAFAPNHKGMAMPPAGSRLDHLHKQVLTSRDVTGGWLVDFMLGGLNYQIEHHLFPSMPRPHLKLAKPMIRDYCAIIGLPFRECGVVESYGECLKYLHQVGHPGESEVRAGGPA